MKNIHPTDVDIQQQFEQGASYLALSLAIFQARWRTKMQRDGESWGEEESGGDLPDEWPLEMSDWWIGQKKEVFISW